MQDFKKFDYVIDFDGIIKAIKDGQTISVIINGEFYDLKTDETPETKQNNGALQWSEL